jgi:glycine/D-amino acid oxidase-like deaminating enzyme
MPYLGPVPGLPGHYHSGIMLAPLTGVLLKKMMLQQPTTRAVAPYHVARLTVFP